MFKVLLPKGTALVLFLLSLSLGISSTSQAQSEDTHSNPNKIEKLTQAVHQLEALVKTLSLDLRNSGVLSQDGTEGLYPRLLATEAFSKDIASTLRKASARLSQLETAHKKQSRSAQHLLKTQAEVDSQIKALQEAVATLALRQEKSESAVLEVGNRLVDLSARSEQVDSRISKLQEVLTQISALQPVVASLQAQIQRLDTQLSQEIASEQENAIQTQMSALREHLTALQSQLETVQTATGSASDKRIERLQEAVGQILIESQMNRLRINEIETKLTALRDEPKPSPTPGEKEPPSPTTPSIIPDDLAARLHATEQVAKEAKSAVDSAYTIALIALLAGIAGIVVGLIL
jgi:DNA repair exonuclease SbcCD ATPase subunit